MGRVLVWDSTILIPILIPIQIPANSLGMMAPVFGPLPPGVGDQEEFWALGFSLLSTSGGSRLGSESANEIALFIFPMIHSAFQNE